MIPFGPASDPTNHKEKMKMNTKQTVGESIYSRSTLPEFKCHKRVKAARIVEIVGHATLSVDLYLDDGLDPIGVAPDWISKHQPQIGSYYVLYNDGYSSVSPAQAFEEGYLEVAPMMTGGVQSDIPPLAIIPGANTNFSFGVALLHLEAGSKVARAGWNGKGMWLILVPGTTQCEFREGSPYRSAGLVQADINPHIDMMTADGKMQPGWLASQTDMLAMDWVLV